jgi:hypothetical protein
MNLALPINKQATKIIRASRCETCKYAEREQGVQSVYSCHKNPPGVSILPTKAGPMPFAAFPLVEPEHWCGAHKMKLNGGGE